MFNLAFYTKNPEIVKLLTSLNEELYIVTSDESELLEHLSSLGNSICFIDYDFKKKKSHKLNKKIKELEGVSVVLFGETLNSKELMKIQKSKDYYHAIDYGTLSLQSINDILNDFETIKTVKESGAFFEGDTLQKIPLSILTNSTESAAEEELVKKMDLNESDVSGFESESNTSIQNIFDKVYPSEESGEDLFDKYSNNNESQKEDKVMSNSKDDLDDISATLNIDLGELDNDDRGNGDIENLTITDQVSAENDAPSFSLDESSDEATEEATLEEAVEAASEEVKIEDMGISLDSLAPEGDDEEEVENLEEKDHLTAEFDFSANSIKEDENGENSMEFDLGEVTTGTSIEEINELEEGSLNFGTDLSDDFASEEATSFISTSDLSLSNEEDNGSEEKTEFKEFSPSSMELPESLDGGFDLGESSDLKDELDLSDESLPDFSLDDMSDEPSAVTKISDAGGLSFDGGKKSDSNISLSSFSAGISKEDLNNISEFNESELLRLQATISQLRKEREIQLEQISKMKEENHLLEQENLSLRAELDEVNIELSIHKKRHLEELGSLKEQFSLADEKKQMYEKKARELQGEFERLSTKVRVDFNKVRQREKQLADQLELVKMDSDAQVKSRDNKILELKRKIDSLEFNMENISIRDQKSKEDKVKLEDKLNKVMQTLRNSIEVLEEDLDLNEGNELLERDL